MSKFYSSNFFFLKGYIKYEQLAYSVHLPPFSVTAFPIEKKSKISEWTAFNFHGKRSTKKIPQPK